MTRAELSKLRRAFDRLCLCRYDEAEDVLDALISEVEREHIIEDLHNDWAELDESALAKVA